MSVSNIDGANPPRLCLVKKREDFQGYGFNLQAEKGKPGQFIGNVDPGSPAETSGVKKNDRVIEVNGVNVCNEAHKQVVSRIKENPSEVTLLLMDPESERKFLENGIVIRSEMDIVEKHGIPNGNSADSRHETPAASVAAELEEEAKPDISETEEIEHQEVTAEDNVVDIQEVQEENGDGQEAVTKEEEEVEISVTSRDSEIEDIQKETTQEDGLDASSEHGSGTYEVAATAERLNAEESTEEAKEDTVISNGISEAPTPSTTAETVPEKHTTHHDPSPSLAVNGNGRIENRGDSIFSMSASQARAAQSRSRRRAIKETKQTFKEKYLLFENL